MPINIAIDGPSGAGKSTLARKSAQKLGFIYVDTGALYRAVGLYALRAGKDTKSAGEIGDLLPKIQVELKFAEGMQRVYLNGEDVSDAIRTPDASMAASNVSAIPAVRSFLFDLQRKIAANNDCIMDGRDIGTVILPDAKVKIFLTASTESRAQRRYEELLLKDSSTKFDDVLADMIKRDAQDSSRAVAPLKPAADAVILDTSGYTLEQGFAALIGAIEEKL